MSSAISPSSLSGVCIFAGHEDVRYNSVAAAR
jgi:hypothetical protein